MIELIETIVKPLVDHPDDVTVSMDEQANKIVFTLSVNQKDMGKVIGKQGRVAKAIRTVVYTAASKNDKKVYLEIRD
jgi:predicted RNA-binding protein YlqC (UPF0109 family)